MKYQESLPKEQEKLREQIRLLSQKVNDDVYQQRQHTFGRIATIIEATVADPEQRKSVKDLVSNAIYSDSYWNGISFQFGQFAEAQGFKLWNDDNQIGCVATTAEPMNQYEKV